MTAQSSLLSASAILEIDGQKIYVEQILEVQLPDSVRQLKLRILDFEGSSLSNISIISNGKQTSFEKEEENALTTLKLISSEGFQKLKLSYWVHTAEPDFYIPFFFTDLPAVNSDNGFFKTAIRLPQTQEYTIHFPNVALNETVDGSEKLVSFSVPALVSVLRMELLHGEQGIGFANVMDGLVAFIFVIMGILIWINRKHLAYA